MKVEHIGSNMTQVAIDDLIILVSYDMPVAYYSHDFDKAYRTEKKWSSTTTRHINKWLAMLGIDHAEEVPQESIDSLY